MKSLLFKYSNSLLLLNYLNISLTENIQNNNKQQLQLQKFQEKQEERYENNIKRKKQNGLDHCVGNTPLIYINSLSSLTGCHIYGKCEFMNPTGSVKDRAALNILEEAEKNGLLSSGGTIVEGTGGNTGIALAQLGISRGYKVILCMPQSISQEKIELMKRLGAEVHLQPSVPFSNPQNYAQKAAIIAKELNAFHTNQFENLSNYRAHISGTGPEIWNQTNHQVDVFITSAGTGGTLAGISTYLKQVNPNIKCYVADPHGSSLFHYILSNGQSMSTVGKGTIMEGIGINRITNNFKAAQLDGAVSVSDQEAVDMAYYLLKTEGLYIGPSAALNVAAATKMALREKNSGKTIVTILCDGGERNASKLYNLQWLESNNLTPKSFSLTNNNENNNENDHNTSKQYPLLDFISPENT